MRILSADLESNLLCPGIQAPPPVCGQWCIDRGDPVLRHVQDWDLQWHTFLSGGFLLNGHNFAFDMAVLCAHNPRELMPLVFEAYENDRITDTQIRQKLLETALGTREEHTKYGLGDVAKRALGVDLDKKDPYRFTYGLLIETPVAQWPLGAEAYALLDATTQRDLYFKQEELAELCPGVFRPQFLEACAAFWLHLASCWGMMTDRPTIDRYRAGVLADLKKDEQLLRDTIVTYEHPKRGRVQGPLLRKDDSKDTKAAAQLMLEACERKGIKPKRTAKGGISLDEDAMDRVGDPILSAYQRYGSASTLLGKVDRLYKGTVTPLQPRYDSLKDTSRTSVSQGDDPKPGEAASAYGSQIQNPPQDQERAKAGQTTFRECFRARPGYYLCPVDFNGAELVTWSQQCIDLIGWSTMADVLNAGRDPHTELGAVLAGITVEEAYQRKKGKLGKALKDEWKAKWRQTAKPANFGLPGGMGAARFKDAARTLYGVDLDLLGLDPEYVKESWKKAWPEQAEYFRWVRDQLTETIRVKNKDTGEWEDLKVGTFIDPRSGFIRGQIPYTVTANMPFQHRAACMAKDAGFKIARDCYLAPRNHVLHGTRIWAFLHDEIIYEIPIDRAAEAAPLLADLQCQYAKSWVPDVLLTAEPALMVHWHKNAEAVRRKDGTLIPWDSEEGIERRAELEREAKMAELAA